MEVVKLTKDDLDPLIELIQSRSNFIGFDESQIHLHQKVSIQNAADLLNVGDAYGSVFGLWSNNQLEGALFTALSFAQPCYFITKAYTRPGASLSTLSDLFDHTIRYYEKRGFQRFYTLYRKDDIGKYHRLWRTTKVLKNYISYTDLEVPPLTRVKHSDYWDLMFGRALFPVTMSVRGFVYKSDTMFMNEENL